MIAVMASPAFAERGHHFATPFGSPGSGDGQLQLAPVERSPDNNLIREGGAGSGLAINESTHDVYVADTGNHRVVEFDSNGNFIRAFGADVGGAGVDVCATGCLAGTPGSTPGQLSEPIFIAVDNDAASSSHGDVYVADRGDGIVTKFDSSGNLISAWAAGGQLDGSAAPEGPFKRFSGIAVDPLGDLWVGNQRSVFEFSSQASFIRNWTGQERPAADAPAGIAIDATGDIYALYNGPGLGGPVEKLAPAGTFLGWLYGAYGSGQKLTTTSLTVVPTSGEVYLDQGDSIETIPSSCEPITEEIFSSITEADYRSHHCSISSHLTSPDLTEGAGIAFDAAAEGSLFIAEPATDRILPFLPEPPGPPVIVSEWTNSVGAEDVLIQAELEPKSFPTEAETEYQFEYLTRSEFEANGESFAQATSIPLPNGRLAPDFEDHTVSAHLNGLQPKTEYLYRLSAENSHSIEPTRGRPLSFATDSLVPLPLPDGRHWEQVSPSDKHGSSIYESVSDVASVNGDSVAYVASSPTEAGAAGAASETRVLSSRGPAGWASHDLNLPHLSAAGAFTGEYFSFSEDLSRALVNPAGAVFNPFLSPEASEQTAYLRSDFIPGQATSFCLSGCYRPLVTAADAPLGTRFADCPYVESCMPTAIGASADARHVVLSNVRSVKPVGLTETPGDEGGLYEWYEGHLAMVSVLPGAAGPAPVKLLPLLGSAVSEVSPPDHKIGAVSADGSRVIWSEDLYGGRSPLFNHLYLRDLATEETVKLDTVKGGAGTGPALPVFQAASADGSIVFFTDEERLTPDSGAEPGHPDLYRCQLVRPEEEGALTCQLTDLTPEASGQPGGAVGSVLGASKDGSTVYFVANGVLSSNQVDWGDGPETAQAGECDPLPQDPTAGAHCNLYLYREGSTKFIATLSSEDESAWDPSMHQHASRVSSNGKWLAFPSQRRLSGYDNTDSQTGLPDQEVFLYHVGGGEAGELHCASCDPSGARPHGLILEAGGAAGSTVIRRQLRYGRNQGVAATLTGSNFTENYLPRNLSDSGRLFFDSAGALLPQDSNGLADIYQYEPPGIGDCGEESSAYFGRNGGCLGLISSGTSPRESFFLDASGSGDDVFFVTSSKLLGTDADSAYDVYDAHVCSSEAPCLPPPPPPKPSCEGDACQQPATPPVDPTPGSLTFQGAGNVVECPKGKVEKSGKCVAKKSNKKKHKHHKKSKNRHARVNRGGAK
ncbi:MAG TPA: hypothetical protein VGO13_09535 [Solirubrobacterales bacterium]|jgi:hypothetical protein|nr:hypothetical protein [Solirubrobacterales bacterium]